MTMQQIVSGEDARIQIREINNSNPFATLAGDVKAGLLQQPKQLPPKYFYDEIGSQLFERICGTPEYYPTRTEEALLKEKSDEIIAHVRPASILELGSGSSRKTRHLLNACDAQQCYSKYLPFDVCGEMMLSAGQHLTCHYDWLEVEAMVGDYCHDLMHLPCEAGPRLVAFLGGTIGNFDANQAQDFLSNVHAIMSEEDRLLLGADRVKESALLNAAYNDAQGHTAAFNRNVLSVINRELNGDFDVECFAHHAVFNEVDSQIEMRLRSLLPQSVRLGGLDAVVDFERDETILTEISRKFTPQSLAQLLEQAGFEIERHFEPANHYYSLVVARP